MRCDAMDGWTENDDQQRMIDADGSLCMCVLVRWSKKDAGCGSLASKQMDGFANPQSEVSCTLNELRTLIVR